MYRCGRSGTDRVVCDRPRSIPLVAGLLVLLAGATVAPVVAPSTAGAAPRPPVVLRAPSPASGSKYYVVKPATNGQREYLYQIAVETLGDGNRFREIFELNKDRRQSDGGQLTDAVELRPGWVLILPDDARGPDVLVGPIPQESGEAGKTAVAAPAGPDSSTGGGTPYVIGAVALVVMAGLLAAALRLFRGGRRQRGGVPELALASATASVSAIPPMPAVPVTPAAKLPVVVPVPADGPPRLEPGRVAVVLESLVDDRPERVDVRLRGSGLPGASEVCAWLGGDEPLPPAVLPMVLGRQGRWRFFVDLAGTPDVFTVGASPEIARRQALMIARQAIAGGLSVTVVGDVIGADELAGARRVETFPAPGSALERDPKPGVIISAGLRGDELTAARGLVTRTDRRLVPVLVGDVLRARWSMLVTESEAVPVPALDTAGQA